MVILTLWDPSQSIHMVPRGWLDLLVMDMCKCLLTLQPLLSWWMDKPLDMVSHYIAVTVAARVLTAQAGAQNEVVAIEEKVIIRAVVEAAAGEAVAVREKTARRAVSRDLFTRHQ